MPDCARFMLTHQVTSPAKDFFTSLRRYPSMRGEVESSMRGLRAALGHAYRAAHGVCERLVKLKVSCCLTLFQVLNAMAHSRSRVSTYHRDSCRVDCGWLWEVVSFLVLCLSQSGMQIRLHMSTSLELTCHDYQACALLTAFMIMTEAVPEIMTPAQSKSS